MTEQNCRSNLLQRKVNVEQLRKEIRKEFQERLRISRYKEQSERRNILNDVFSNLTDHCKEIHQRLLANVPDVSPEEMFNIMLDIEDELVNDVDATSNERLGLCSICNSIIQVNNNLPCVICNNCVTAHFSSNF